MPIYVYKCTECNEYHEALQKASDEPLKTCPFCQAEALTKVIAPVGVIFKGTGFHKNDYSAKKSTASTSKPAETPTSESKTETSSSPPASSGDSGGGSSSAGDKVA